MIKMWNNDTIFVCPQIDVNKELDIDEKTKQRKHKVTFEECVEDLRAIIKRLEKSGKNENSRMQNISVQISMKIISRNCMQTTSSLPTSTTVGQRTQKTPSLTSLRSS